MAKIRVYELAKDLNITNKVLLEKMQNMGVPVKSHMGSVDDTMVEKIKSSLFGEKPKEVEVVRVKPTVIRRRKKKVVAKETAIEEEIAEPEVEVIIPEETVEKEKADDISPEKTEIKKPVHKHAAKRKRKDTPAKIIKLAAIPPSVKKIK